MNLKENFDLVYNTLKELTAKKAAYLAQLRPVPPDLLSKEEKLRGILQRIQQEEDLRLDQKIAFQALLSEFKASKKAYWKNKSKHFFIL